MDIDSFRTIVNDVPQDLSFYVHRNFVIWIIKCCLSYLVKLKDDKH